MTRTDAQEAPKPGKGKAFFDRADQVAATGNWDYAIDLYLEGLRREPENVDRGHKPCRDVSLKRKAQGGKGPGMLDQLKRRPAKDPVESLINAEFLLSRQPGSVAYMEQTLAAIRKLDLHKPELIKWICDIMLETERLSTKKSKRTLVHLTEAFNELEEYGSAIQACEMARELDPDDANLQTTLGALSAKYTIKKGKYDQEGEFTRAVVDMDKQKELSQRDALVQDRGYLEQMVERTKKEYLQTPTVPGKINAYADALLKFEEEGYENEAIDVLNKAFKDTGAYQFRMRVGDIHIRQMARRYRKLLAEGQKDAAAEQARAQLDFELREYADRVVNYPTDLSLKYEHGRRLILAGKLDEAIAAFQAAARDPRRHVQAMTYLGQAFARKGWHREAAETFEKVLQSELSEERGKEIRYSLGDVLEQMGQLERAQEQFSHVAQLDYNFRDVRVRLENIRKKLS